MFETLLHLLAEMFFYCWRFLKAELPNCALILNDLRLRRRSIPHGSQGFVWLCYITGFASIVRTAAIVWFTTAVIDLVAHLNLGWPPFQFVENRHHFQWGFSLADASSLPSVRVHYCVIIGVMAMTTFVASSLSYFGVARLSRELVAILCPIRPRVKHKTSQNDVA